MKSTTCCLRLFCIVHAIYFIACRLLIRLWSLSGDSGVSKQATDFNTQGLSTLFTPVRQPLALRVSTKRSGDTLTGLKIGLSSQPLRVTTLIRCRGLSYDFVSLGSSTGDSSSLMKRLSLSISLRKGVSSTFPLRSLVFSCLP